MNMTTSTTSDVFRQAAQIARKDVMAEMRAKEIAPQMLAFAALLIVIFNVTLRAETILQDALPGVLWVSLTFAGMLGLNHSFLQEQENGCLLGLRLCPVSRTVIFLGKMLGNFFLLLFTELTIFPVIMILFNLTPEWQFILLGIVMALGAFGFACIGTLFAAMSSQTRIREALLPMLVFPLLIPLLIAAAQTTAGILAHAAWRELSFGFQFLIVFDLMFAGVALLTSEYVIDSE